MIIIRILSGPHAGKERELHGSMYEGVEINPLHLLEQLMELGSRWQIDYSQATEGEKFDWGRADLAGRIVRALIEGRSVFFQGRRYQAPSKTEVKRLAGEIDDDITASGYLVTIGFDDERGVSIVTGQREHPLQ